MQPSSNDQNSSRKITAAIFDYGGVMSFSPLWRVELLADAMQVPKEIFSKIIFGGAHSDRDNPWHEAECGRQSLDMDFAEKMQKRVAPYGATFDLDFFLPWVSEAENHPDPAMIQVVNELRQAGYRLALLTNAVREFRPVIEKTVPIYDLFDVIVDSSEVGMRKPDKEIYDLASQNLGVENSQCLMIDDLIANVQGAENAGMQGLLFTTSDETSAAIRNTFQLDIEIEN
ncbi:MAG: hypothetical protein CL522_01115 [Actinobacteria bacterium]|nr:hypothetical protein [Actinomycetota bacterium]